MEAHASYPPPQQPPQYIPPQYTIPQQPQYAPQQPPQYAPQQPQYTLQQQQPQYILQQQQPQYTPQAVYPPTQVTQVQTVYTPAEKSPRNVSCYQGLAITQILLGCLTLIAGIIAVTELDGHGFAGSIGTGIWAGAWIVSTGVLGWGAYRQNKQSMNGAYMALSIVSTIVAGLAGIFFLTSFWVFGIMCAFERRKYQCNLGLAVHILAMILMLVEFVVSIIAAVKCCYNGCCSSGGSVGTVLVQPQPEIQMQTVHTTVVATA